MEDDFNRTAETRQQCRRRDVLTAQRIEVGLVFLEMLGLDDAKEYYERIGLPPQLFRRILEAKADRRLDPDCWLSK
jgi:hypothetical protein